MFEDLSAVPSTAVQYPNPACSLLSPNYPQSSDTLQVVAVPTVVETTSRVTPKVSGSGLPAQPGGANLTLKIYQALCKWLLSQLS